MSELPAWILDSLDARAAAAKPSAIELAPSYVAAFVAAARERNELRAKVEELTERLRRACQCCERPNGVCLDKDDLWGPMSPSEIEDLL